VKIELYSAQDMQDQRPEVFVRLYSTWSADKRSSLHLWADDPLEGIMETMDRVATVAGIRVSGYDVEIDPKINVSLVCEFYSPLTADLVIQRLNQSGSSDCQGHRGHKISEMIQGVVKSITGEIEGRWFSHRMSEGMVSIIAEEINDLLSVENFIEESVVRGLWFSSDGRTLK